tara:strand:- start:140 stop:418 length:279 start_codon:yes stop_codon:yes gene_type:complete
VSVTPTGDKMTATTTQEAQPTNARKQELFDHLLYYLYHDCHVYAYAHKGDPFYEHLEEELGEIKGSDLEALSVIAKTLAEYIHDFEYHMVFA